jgi:hypothetical protein
MIIDFWIERKHNNDATLRLQKITCEISTMYVARVGIFNVSLEILKPKEEFNHERTTERG